MAETETRNTVTLSDSDRGLRAAAGTPARGRARGLPDRDGLRPRRRRPQRPCGGRHLRRQGPPRLQSPDRARARPRRRRGAGRVPLCRPAPRRAFWPGPLTLVLPRRPGCGLSDLVSAGLPTVAIRVPAHPLARRLLAAFGGPIAAPSANPSGKVSPTTARARARRPRRAHRGGARRRALRRRPRIHHPRLRERRAGAAPPRRPAGRGDRGRARPQPRPPARRGHHRPRPARARITRRRPRCASTPPAPSATRPGSASARWRASSPRSTSRPPAT
jgi:hypothetical protein